MRPEERVVWPSQGKAALEEFSAAAPAGDEVLVRTRFTLVSQGTERGWLSGKYDFPFPGAGFPFHPGYSLVGRIEATGPEVRSFQVGDTVFTTNGGYGCHASALTVSESRLFRIPGGTDLRRSLFFAVADVALAAVRRARVELGETGLIVGLGLLGQLAVQAAAAAGSVPVIGIDPDPGRRELAHRSGAQLTFAPEDREGLRAALADRGGADFAIELVGGKDEPLQLAIDSIGRYGRVIGAARTPRASSLDLTNGLFLKNATLTQMHIMARPDAESRPGLWSVADQWHAYRKLIDAGRMDPLLLPCAEITPDELPGFYEQLVHRQPGHVATVVSWPGV